MRAAVLPGDAFGSPPLEPVPANGWTWRNVAHGASFLSLGVGWAVFAIFYVLPAYRLSSSPLASLSVVVSVVLLTYPLRYIAGRLLPPNPGTLQVSPAGLYIGLANDERWYPWHRVALAGGRLTVRSRAWLSVNRFTLLPAQADRVRSVGRLDR